MSNQLESYNARTDDLESMLNRVSNQFAGAVREGEPQPRRSAPAPPGFESYPPTPAMTGPTRNLQGATPALAFPPTQVSGGPSSYTAPPLPMTGIEALSSLPTPPLSLNPSSSGYLPADRPAYPGSPHYWETEPSLSNLNLGTNARADVTDPKYRSVQSYQASDKILGQGRRKRLYH
jgi:hypothetical protein